MNGEDIDYDYIYHPEDIPGHDEIPDKEDERCMDCGSPAAYFCQDCGDFVCGICMICHEEQHEYQMNTEEF